MTDKITSKDNPKIKALRALLNNRKERWESQNFVVETPTHITELIEKGAQCQTIFYTDTPPEKSPKETIQITPELAKHISSLKTPPGTFGCFQMPTWPELQPKNCPTLLILDQIQNPANFGAIIRNAAAFNVDAILTTPGSCDPYHPESIRAATSTIIQTPIYTCDKALFNTLKSTHTCYALSSHSPTTIQDIKPTTHTGYIFGSESQGIITPWLKDEPTIAIPTHTAVESLNLSVATGILLYIHSQNNSKI